MFSMNYNDWWPKRQFCTENGQGPAVIFNSEAWSKIQAQALTILPSLITSFLVLEGSNSVLLFVPEAQSGIV